MPAFRLRHFSSIETLRGMQPRLLLALLGRHSDYFQERGVDLGPRKGTSLDIEAISSVLMNPDESTPVGLSDDLFFVDEMATPEGMEALCDEIRKLPEPRRASVDAGPGPTPADVAVNVRLLEPQLIERKHAESHIQAKKSFLYFPTARGKKEGVHRSVERQLRLMERDLGAAFDEMKRGHAVRAFFFERPDGFWLIVNRGDPYKREAAISGPDSKSVYFRPEVTDVLRYDSETRDLSVSAGSSKKIHELYRETVGQHLFGDKLHFDGSGAKFTLDPLRVDGEASLVCTDIDGMESVVLVEFQIVWGGKEGEVEIRRASDIFAAYSRKGRTIPAKGRLAQAKFRMKFEDSKTPRTVSITGTHRSSFTRDSDAKLVEAWMIKRGFALDNRDDDE